MAIIDLAGTIDGGADAALDAAYDACDEPGAGTVALDFTKVEYINSTGIALLVSLLAKARRDGRPGGGVGPDRPLPGDLRDHPAGGLPRGGGGRAGRSDRHRHDNR